MAAPIVAVAAKAAAKTFVANEVKKQAIKTLSDSAIKKATSKTPYLDKLRAMKPKNKNGDQQEKTRERISIAQDLMSETAIVKMIDDVLQKFNKVRKNVNDNLKKQGLVKEITAEANKNTSLSNNMTSMAKDIKEVSTPKHRNKMR